MMRYFDTHAHLDDERFAEDIEAVVARAAAAGLCGIITIGIDAATSRANVALAERFPLLRSAVGIQPNHVSEAVTGDWETILDLVQHPTCVAVGETGLDRYWDRAPFPLQEEYFTRHLELARRTQKPVIIHNREADADLIRMLTPEFEKHGPLRGILHSFTGTTETAKTCLAFGLHISFAGMLTYKNAEALRQTAATLPLERLLIETDSPYLAPVPKRSGRNEPAFVVHTAQCLAKVLGIPEAKLAEQTTANARELFRV